MRVNLELQSQEKMFPISLVLYLYKIMDVHLTECDNHFMMHIKHTLNLHHIICQLYSIKVGGKKILKIF